METVSYESRIAKDFLLYALHVVKDRSLPDVRDGLKPVHRRILYAALELGLTPDKVHRKSVRIVGDAMAKFHPHGDQAVYQAMVRMAQDFNMRYPLIDGQGNFGSIDGDAAAAMRYTEARLSKFAMLFLEDTDNNTVDFTPNFDASMMEPIVLPAAVPNLLANGSEGIAVGVSTSIPPHNLAELIDALIYLQDHPDCSVDDLMQYIPGPDFPTGGIIVGTDGIREAYRTGKGRIVIRAKAKIEELSRGRSQIVVTEIPYQVNKASLLQTIGDLSDNNRIDGITDIRDESDKNELRVVIEVRRGVDPKIVLNRLYKFTELQKNYAVQMMALVNERPKLLTLKDALVEYLTFKRSIVTRRVQHYIDQASKRLHIVTGLIKAVDALDEVIQIIRSSRAADTARAKLMQALHIDETQANAILQMQLQRLMSTEIAKLKREEKDLKSQIREWEKILKDPETLKAVIREEFEAVKKEFGDPRRTQILSDDDVSDSFSEKEIVPKLPTCVSVSGRGYVKRHANLDAHRPLKSDAPKVVLEGTTHDRLVLFTDLGNAYSVPVHQIAEHHALANGDPLRTYVEIPNDETVVGCIMAGEDNGDQIVYMATTSGMIKASRVEEYVTRRTCIQAIKLEEGDRVVRAWIPNPGEDKMVMVTRNEFGIYFPIEQVPVTGRVTQGVVGIRLDEGNTVIAAFSTGPEDSIRIIDEGGWCCHVRVAELYEQNRGGKGKRVTMKGVKAVYVLPGRYDDIAVFTTDNNFRTFPAAAIREQWTKLKEVDIAQVADLWAIPVRGMPEKGDTPPVQESETGNDERESDAVPSVTEPESSGEDDREGQGGNIEQTSLFDL